MDLLAPAVPGQVYIVGAGPGDPGLITARGARLLADADVVLYDDLLDPRLLDITPHACQRSYVGHRAGRDSGVGRQEQINARLVAEARARRRVVRLKGGDPYIFGRGGEEALALRAAGVPFEVVPGVSAASAALAYAGIPLTHRGVSTTATLVTGHGDPAGDDPKARVDWEALARAGGTLVVFMGSRRLPAITEALLAGGRHADTPAAAVRWGTWPQQRTVVATLSTLAAQIVAAGLESPLLIVVGEVVALRDRLDWFERRPLFGRRLLVTRSREQAGDLQVLLESAGAQVDSLPLLEISPAADPAPLDAALHRLHEFGWVVFTSPKAVRFVCERLAHLGRDARAFGPACLAAVGAATAQALQERSLTPDLVPQVQSAAGLAAAFDSVDLRRTEVLLPASAIGRSELDEALAARGAVVLRVTAYENRPPSPERLQFPEALTAGALDGVVFASPSSVRNFLEVAGPQRGLDWLRALDIAVIGPTTAAAVRELDLEVAVQPGDNSIDALVSALCEHYARA